MKLLLSTDAFRAQRRVEFENYLVSWLSVIGQVVGLRIPFEMLNTWMIQAVLADELFIGQDCQSVEGQKDCKATSSEIVLEIKGNAFVTVYIRSLWITQMAFRLKYPLQPLARKRMNTYNKAQERGFPSEGQVLANGIFCILARKCTVHFQNSPHCLSAFVYGLLACNFVSCSGEANQEFGVPCSTL